MMCRNQKGVEIVEFALILPLLVIFLFGILEFGLILYNQAVIANAAREGARQGILVRPDASVPLSEIESKVNEYTGNLITGGEKKFTSEITPCSDPPVPNGKVHVKVAFLYSFFAIGWLLSPIELKSTSEMLCERSL